MTIGCEGRLRELWQETGDGDLLRLSRGQNPRGLARIHTERDLANAVSSCVMATYRDTGHALAFDLLVELCGADIARAVRGRLRPAGVRNGGADDVIQDVWLCICRYRESYRCERADSFRVWSHRIAHNSAIRAHQVEARRAAKVYLDPDGAEPADPFGRTPSVAAEESESAKVVDFAYLTYLNMYLLAYQRLSDRERLALQLVEVERKTYAQTAAALGVRVEVLKMVVFRGRRKILRHIEQHLRHLNTWCS